MKRTVLFVVLAYAVLFMVLTWPILLVSFYDPDQGWLSAHVIITLFTAPGYWVFIGILLLSQAGLLLIPVQITDRRPTSRRSIYAPIIASGFLMGTLFYGMICSLGEFLRKGAAFNETWEVWTAIGCAVIIWMAWGFVFCRLTSGQEPKQVVLRQCRHLLQGSVIALLVAVPTHIVARHRDYCCGGFYTFVGIVFGLAVMLLSFGPGIYFLYVERWRKLHPGTDEDGMLPQTSKADPGDDFP